MANTVINRKSIIDLPVKNELGINYTYIPAIIDGSTYKLNLNNITTNNEVNQNISSDIIDSKLQVAIKQIFSVFDINDNNNIFDEAAQVLISLKNKKSNVYNVSYTSSNTISTEINSLKDYWVNF